MAIDYTLLNKGIIPLGGNNFSILGESPLDSRLVIPTLDGLQNLIDNAATYEGMIAYITSEKKHYEVKTIDGVLSYRQFGLTEEELNELITNATTAAMEFKGATATLPENPSKGDMWKVTGPFAVGEELAKVGDSIVYNGTEWFLIPSGDDIEDTWRPVDGVANDATLKFAAGVGAKLDVAVAADGTITYSHEEIADPALLAENEQTRTYITAVETDGYGHITGYKTATENVVDTNTEYTFESQVESSSVYFNVTPDAEGAVEQTVYVDAYSKNEVDGKVKILNDGIAAVDEKYGAMIKQDENDNITIGTNPVTDIYLDGYTVTLGILPPDDPSDSEVKLYGHTTTKGQVTFEADPNGAQNVVDIKVPAYYWKDGKAHEIATRDDIPANAYEGYISAGELGDGEDVLALHAAQRITADADYIELNGDVTVNGKALKTTQTAVANKITDAAHVINSLTQNANGEITYGVKKLTPADIGAQPAGNYLSASGSGADDYFTLTAGEKITLEAQTEGITLIGDTTIDGNLQMGNHTATISSINAQTIVINHGQDDYNVGDTLAGLGDLANKDKVTESDIDGTIASTKISGLGALAAKDTIAEGDITGTIAVGKISGLGALATKSKVAEGDISGTIAHTKISGLGTFATKSELSYNDLNDKPTLGALAAKDKIVEGDIEGTIATDKIDGLGALATKNDITHDLVTDFGTAVKAVKVDAAVDADKLGGVEAANYALKTDVTGAIQALDSNVKATAGSVLTGVTITDGKLTAKEELALHEVATTGSIYDVAEGANANTGTDKTEHPEYLIFNCGTASTVI